MTVLDIGRLHARYHEVDDIAVRRLDDALAVLHGRALDETVATGALPTWVDDVHAVCIRSIRSAVTIDADAPTASMAEGWARSICAEVVRATESDAGVVVYVSELDATIALARAAIIGIDDEVWALRQIGLVPAGSTTATTDHLVTALVDRPTLIPATLTPLGLRHLGLTPSQWLRLAGAFVGAATRRPDARWAGAPRMGALPAGVVGEAARLIVAHDAAAHDRSVGPVPGAAFTAVADDPASAAALAVLALAMTRPGQSADPTDVAATAMAALAGELPDAPATDAGTTRPGAPSAERMSEDEPIGSDGGLEVTGPDVEVSSWGGVLYLVHLLDGGSVEVVAAAVAAVTGAPVDDPAVRIVAGWTEDHDAGQAVTEAAGTEESGPEESGPEESGPEESGPGDSGPEDSGPEDSGPEDSGPDGAGDIAVATAAMADRIRRALHSRLDPGSQDDDTAADRSWIWRRHVAITRRPGWIDAEFALRDVDVRIRAAGLDLDPGYVWWLGSVMRFRHV